MSKISSAAFADTKPHYDILDGLRGVAAIMVVWFHLFEAYATSHLDQRINHGYLAVDFFFILSGFVIGYAYDDRWKKKMSVKDFLKRRLIRLHPMVVMGAVIGAVMFYFQGCSVWDVSAVSLSMLLTATLLNALLIPATPGSEIRGLGEMYPLNGPSWSLFFEYIGNVLYALFIRKLPTRALSRAGAARRLRVGGVRRLGAPRRHLRRVRHGRGQHARRLSAPAVRLLGRTAAFTCVQARADSGRVLDLRPGDRDAAVRAAHRGKRTFVDERAVRYPVRRSPLSAARLSRGFGKDDGPGDDPGLQISGGHFLPAVHGALPFHLPLLRLGQERKPHLHGVPARRPGARRGICDIGLSLSETLRRACAPVPDRPLFAQGEIDAVF